MSINSAAFRIGIYGPDEVFSGGARGCDLWGVGYESAIREAGGIPVQLPQAATAREWQTRLEEIGALVWTGSFTPGLAFSNRDQRVAQFCRERRLPLLAVDQGLLTLNSICGGTSYEDLASQCPEALQHRHPPERGLRHAITVESRTRLAALYGDGEIIVNSEHRWGICKVARGFRVSGRALDGTIEAIESEEANWFAIGVQWRPASPSASGLDIQLFRGLVNACLLSRRKFGRAPAAKTPRLHLAFGPALAKGASQETDQRVRVDADHGRSQSKFGKARVAARASCR